MIRYALTCDNGHAFEGWFAKSDDFDSQKAMGFLTCPSCGSVDVGKSLMAPSVATGRQKDVIHALAIEQAQKNAIAKMKQAIASIKANSEDVGERFPEEARKIHYGEADARGIIGQASPSEVKALVDEGIDIAPIPVLPDDVH
ncbi:DUF1178 family protein [Rhizobium sp. CG5]|uniref:DUF1178 family protein n=1 Tax=Rhizobium sp. CG5 TaxID=2726076 RepID=UPI002033B09B|nr:DUF1178 family protein [Rhizobium sp. CG5]MCM2475178.1 DUF1178 family protein [Rhizobium sp. CG5]